MEDKPVHKDQKQIAVVWNQKKSVDPVVTNVADNSYFTASTIEVSISHVIQAKMPFETTVILLKSIVNQKCMTFEVKKTLKIFLYSLKVAI